MTHDFSTDSNTSAGFLQQRVLGARPLSLLVGSRRLAMNHVHRILTLVSLVFSSLTYTIFATGSDMLSPTGYGVRLYALC